MNEVMKQIQEQNDQCTFFLTSWRYDGSALSFKLNKKKVTAPVTCPNSNERIEVIAKAKSHGVLFHST